MFAPMGAVAITLRERVREVIDARHIQRVSKRLDHLKRLFQQNALETTSDLSALATAGVAGWRVLQAIFD
jgi:hypothetical protein